MSTFEDQKFAVADLLDYLINTRDFTRMESGEDVLSLVSSDLDKTKMSYDDLCVMLRWMQKESWVTVAFEFTDIDDYKAVEAENDGYEVPIFKIEVTPFGKTAIEKVLTNSSVKPRGFKFEKDTGCLYLDGKIVHRFTMSKPTFSIFQMVWDYSRINSQVLTDGQRPTVKYLSDKLDLKRDALLIKITEMNRAFVDKKIPVPLKICVNDDSIFLEVITGKK